MNHNLKVDVLQLYYKTFYMLKSINYHSDGKKTHIVDCVHVFQSFDHVDNLKVLEMGFKYCMHLKGWRASSPKNSNLLTEMKTACILGELCLYIYRPVSHLISTKGFFLCLTFSVSLLLTPRSISMLSHSVTPMAYRSLSTLAQAILP